MTGEKSEPVQSPEFETLGRRSQVLAACKSDQTLNLVILEDSLYKEQMHFYHSQQLTDLFKTG